MTLDAVEFVRRFLMHVLPAGFVRVRHYGLLANRHRREKLARCRELLGMAVTPADPAPADPDPTTPPGREAPVTPTRVCPRCGAGRMVVVAEFPPMTPAGGITAGLEPCLDLRQLLIHRGGRDATDLCCHDVTPRSVSDRPREAGWGLPRPRPRPTGSPRRRRRRAEPSARPERPLRVSGGTGRRHSIPIGEAKSARREAASSSAFVSARPTRPGSRPRSLDGLADTTFCRTRSRPGAMPGRSLLDVAVSSIRWISRSWPRAPSGTSTASRTRIPRSR